MKKIYLLFVFITGILFFPLTTKAASFSVSASSYNVPIGSTVTVYVKGTDLTGRIDASSDNNKIFSIDGNSFGWIESNTISFKFKAKSAGNVKITLTPYEGIANSKGQIVKDLTAKSIIIKSYVPRALSDDNYLSSLSVDGVDLVPSFDKDTTNYIVDLEPGTTSIKVDATKANKYASVSGTGDISVKEGNNDISVIVTAENGSKRAYKITAVVKEYAPINVNIGGSDFTVVRKSKELTKPQFYTETTVKIGEDVIPGFYNEKTGYTLVGLKDVTGSIKLYKYNNGGYEKYTSLEFNQMNLIVLDAPEASIPKDFIKDTITINNEVIDSYKNTELGITLIYGKSIITGENNFYEYENTDFTIQKFNNNAYDKLNEKIMLYSYVIVGLSGLILFILICLIISKIINKTRLKRRKSEIEKTLNIDINRINDEITKDKTENSNINKKEQRKKLKEERRLKKEQEKQKKLREKQLAKELKKQKNNKKNLVVEEKEDNMFKL